MLGEACSVDDRCAGDATECRQAICACKITHFTKDGKCCESDNLLHAAIYTLSTVISHLDQIIQGLLVFL